MPTVTFSVELSGKAIKDLKKVISTDKAIILKKAQILKTNPFPAKNTIRKIKGMKFPCYRLRIDGRNDSYRLFYGLEGKTVLVLRIVSKKEADRIISSMR